METGILREILLWRPGTQHCFCPGGLETGIVREILAWEAWKPALSAKSLRFRSPLEGQTTALSAKSLRLEMPCERVV